MNSKKIFIITAVSISFILAAAAFTASFHISAATAAREKLAQETDTLKKDSVEIKAANNELQKKIEDINTELSAKDTVNNYYMEYKKVHDDLTEEVDGLKSQSAELDKRIAEKREALEGISGLSEGKSGKSYKLKKGETYLCPDDVPPGRYEAAGSGSLTVINPSGKARLAQNLDVSYENSYTFNLSGKEKIMVTGDVTLTELK